MFVSILVGWPAIIIQLAEETQTELSILPVNMWTVHSVGINTTMNTEEASTSIETVYVSKQTQTEAETENKEDIRSVEIVKEDFSYNI